MNTEKEEQHYEKRKTDFYGHFEKNVREELFAFCVNSAKKIQFFHEHFLYVLSVHAYKRAYYNWYNCTHVVPHHIYRVTHMYRARETWVTTCARPIDDRPIHVAQVVYHTHIMNKI